MAKEVENWDSALYTRAIRNVTVYLGTDSRFLFYFYISGMILS